MTGALELATTALVFIPLNKGIEKAGQALLNNKNTFYSGNKDAITQFNSVANRGAKFLFLLPMALLQMSAIKPLVKKMTQKQELKEKRKLDKWA